MTTTKLQAIMQAYADASVNAWMHGKTLTARRMARRFIKLLNIKYYNKIGG